MQLPDSYPSNSNTLISQFFEVVSSTNLSTRLTIPVSEITSVSHLQMQSRDKLVSLTISVNSVRAYVPSMLNIRIGLSLGCTVCNNFKAEALYSEMLQEAGVKISRANPIFYRGNIIQPLP